MFLEIPQISQESTCARVSLLIKLQDLGLRPANLLKKKLWHRYFPVNFAEFLRTPFLTEHLRQLLLFLLSDNFKDSLVNSLHHQKLANRCFIAIKELNGITVRVFFEKKTSKKNTYTVMVRIIITFANQIFL